MATTTQSNISDKHFPKSNNNTTDRNTTTTITTSMTREDLMMLAQNEYARQLCKFTEAQLKRKVPCYTEQQKLGMQHLSVNAQQ